MNFHELFASPFTTYDGPADGGSGGGVESGGEPAPSTSAPAAEPAGAPASAATPPSAPWSDSLSQAFPDEAVRGQVDQYLREQIQPYVTRREQELGTVREVWDNLWDEDNSIPTFLEIANTAYGPELGAAIMETFQKHFEDQGMSPAQAEGAAAEATAQVANEGVDPMDAYLNSLPPQVRDMMEAQINAREDAVYEAQLRELATSEPTITGREELFSKYVGVLDGDLPAAVAQWQQEMAPYLREHPDAFLPGSQESAAAEQRADQLIGGEQGGQQGAQQQAQPSAVLGQGGAMGSSVPPQIPPHQTMDEALSDFMTDLNGRPAI